MSARVYLLNRLKSGIYLLFSVFDAVIMARVLYACYTLVTLLLYICYKFVIRLLYASYTLLYICYKLIICLLYALLLHTCCNLVICLLYAWSGYGLPMILNRCKKFQLRQNVGELL